MFFRHFASKSQLPGFYIGGTLVENGLMVLQEIVSDIIETNMEVKYATLKLNLANVKYYLVS